MTIRYNILRQIALNKILLIINAISTRTRVSILLSGFNNLLSP